MATLLSVEARSYAHAPGKVSRAAEKGGPGCAPLAGALGEPGESVGRCKWEQVMQRECQLQGSEWEG